MIVVLIGAVSAPTISFAAPAQVVYAIVVAGCSLAVLLRRSRPILALSIMAVLLAVHLLIVARPGLFPGVICLIAAYTTQTQLAGPWRWGVLAGTYVGATVGVAMSPIPGLGEDWRSRGLMIAAVGTALTVAALTGVVRRNARDRYDLAVERARALEAQQASEQRLAAVEERARIAREMHDILGHSLNTIAVQAEGARYALHTDPDRADRALADIGQLSRAAVNEVRDLIDVLRTENDPATTQPTPTLRDLPSLIGTLQRAGTPIRLRIDGEVNDVPGHVGLAAYRIIQESLTNAITHADGAPVVVRTTIDDHSLDVLVSNGRPNHTGTRPGSGHGLIGMRERVLALGGTLDAGPDPATGGWRVTAHLPWSRR
ncbi:Sensor histidine kinase DesK [Micromonospora sp. MW-13]|uniref:sensor histidine kinase n=1 Tax=Micromonospora sp. NBC_01655 TaxID=2975983 RepID=UPI000EC87EA2|nr:histidine kinase [Micromonospora sp. NBC_01655]MCX4473027.1 histidine kinase [Micromonospora sp. NBC_01655]RGC65256.1 Sensor histidine kinase DesK [Micromonospora sp. MW-13]